MPTLSTVSIIPGIETDAPERTLTRSGAVTEPSSLPVVRSSAATSVAMACSNSSDQPSARKAQHAAVVSVKPGGTGRPASDMRAKPWPLPPSTSTGSPSRSERSASNE